MFKKFLSFCLAITMILSCISFQAFAEKADVHTAYSEGWGVAAQATASAAGTVTVAAPYAGVYLAESTKAVTITNETGHTATLTANNADYFFLFKGNNTVTFSGAATVKFYGMDGQGLDYISEVALAGDYPRGEENVFVNNVSFKANSSAIVTADIPKSGFYYLSLQRLDTQMNTVITIEADNGMYAAINQTTWGWNHMGLDGTVEYVYLSKGTHTFKITNPSSFYSYFNAFRISEATNWSNDIGWDNVKYVLEDAPIPTTAPTATPTPTATPKPNDTVTYTAPYAGVFQVTSNKAVTLTNETGHYVTLAANTPGKLFLIQGVNTITTSDSSATLTFTELDNQGLEYLSSVAHNDLPYGHNDHTFVTNVNVPAGGSTTVSANVPKAGMYYLSVQRNDTPLNALVTIETETGMYAAINQTGGGWNHMGTDGTVEYVYLRAGQQTFTIHNAGTTYGTFENFRISETVNWHNDLTWDNVKITKYTPPVVYPDYVSDVYIDFPGTASNLAGCLTGGTGASALDSGFIWVSAGYSADFTVPCTDEGVYIVQVKSSNDTTVQVEANGSYYTDVKMNANTFSNKREDGSYAFIYLNEGNNTVTLYNTGSTGFTLYNLEFKATSPLYDEGTPCDESLCLKMAEDTPRPTPSETAAPTATPLPTATPTPTPDMTDAEQFTVYEAESVTFEGVSTASYNGKTAIVATNGYNLVYPITVDNDTTYNLYVTGAAWKDVTLDIRIDGVFYKNYYQYFHLEGKNSTYEYQQDLVATFPLTKGSHTITIIPYADTYYFDSFVLEDHSSRGYKFIHGFEGVNTSQEA
ncbi:MAG: hypothetical protein IKW04_01805, partial [Clostridia bacterium]|nr:hypothetical protein [Clostridia bacterium]